jgi:hypothetical protein
MILKKRSLAFAIALMMSQQNLGELTHLKSVSTITNIVLTGNPGSRKYPRTMAGRCDYERQIRKFFPGLQQLDGTAINSSLPLASKDNYLPDQFRGIVGQFVTK